MYTITVNGEKQQTEQLTVKAVLDELQLTQGRYAVEIKLLVYNQSFCL